MSLVAISGEALRKRYRGAREDALGPVTFAIEPGTSTGLLGANGAGKTTLVKLIAGVIAPTSGVVKALGFEVNTNRRIKRDLGVMHQRLTFDMMMSGLENLKIGLRLHGLTWRSHGREALELCEQFDLKVATLKQPVFTLSGGEMRRLQFVRAIIHRPRILIADEPTVGLDVMGRRGMWDYIRARRLDDGMTLLITSHYVEEIEHNCSNVLILEHGLLRASGPISEVVGRHEVSWTVCFTDSEIRATVMPKLESFLGRSARWEGEDLIITDRAAKRGLESLLSLEELRGVQVQERRARLEEVFVGLATSHKESLGSSEE